MPPNHRRSKRQSGPIRQGKAFGCTGRRKWGLVTRPTQFSPRHTPRPRLPPHRRCSTSWCTHLRAPQVPLRENDRLFGPPSIVMSLQRWQTPKARKPERHCQTGTDNSRYALQPGTSRAQQRRWTPSRWNDSIRLPQRHAPGVGRDMRRHLRSVTRRALRRQSCPRSQPGGTSKNRKVQEPHRPLSFPTHLSRNYGCFRRSDENVPQGPRP